MRYKLGESCLGKAVARAIVSITLATHRALSELHLELVFDFRYSGCGPRGNRCVVFLPPGMNRSLKNDGRIIHIDLDVLGIQGSQALEGALDLLFDVLRFDIGSHFDFVEDALHTE